MSSITNYYLHKTYDTIYDRYQFDVPIQVSDHLGGFSSELNNPILDHVQKYSSTNTPIITEYIFDESILSKYPKLKFRWADTWVNDMFQQYNVHPAINYKNFICSFNGSAHVNRKLLVAILNRFNYFNPDYCSKNFQFTSDIIDGHLSEYLSDSDHRFYRKFFLTDENFCQSINSFDYVRFNHGQNIYTLENKLTESFLHIVSETLATSYYPFVSEKFLYSIVTRGLFLSYAQPGWHNHVEKYYGFKKYNKLFDYQFDTIQNPVERLVELMCMISKFSILSTDDWHDLYLLEQDTIEYNYDHYFSQAYLKNVTRYE
jgi:hypothetical protein